MKLIVVILVLLGQSQSCDENACQIGTSVGSGVCGVISLIPVLNIFGSVCGAALGATSGLCSYCGDEDPEMFTEGEKLLLKLQEGTMEQLTLIVAQVGTLGEAVGTLTASVNRLIKLQEDTMEQLTQIVAQVGTLGESVNRAQIISLYGDDLQLVDFVISQFKLLTKGRFNFIINDIETKHFKEAALHPTQGLEFRMFNIFRMLNGGHILKTESIYAAPNREFCSPATNKYFLDLQTQSMVLLSVALAMDGAKVSAGVKNSFQTKIIEANSTYVQNCGCSSGFRAHNRGAVTALASLPVSGRSHVENLQSINNIDSKETREKFVLLHEWRNIEPTSALQDTVSRHAKEDIEFVLNSVNNNRSVAELALYDNTWVCVVGAEVDPQCSKPYFNFTDATRIETFNDGGTTGRCDRSLNNDWRGNGWYRYTGAAGRRMSNSPPSVWSCGSQGVGYIAGAHPEVEEGSVQRTVCFSWDSNNPCHASYKKTISVINCNRYYLYYLTNVSGCNSRYCGAL